MSLRNLMDPAKTAFARELRKHPTRAERVLWGYLRARRLYGLKFRRQVPILGYIADFYCAERHLVVEVDGSGHNPTADAQRDRAMLLRGIRTLRFSNDEVLNDLATVLGKIAAP